MRVQIAVVQLQIALHQREVNFQRIEKYIEQTKNQGAQVIVFPEDCITASIFGDLSKLDTSQANRALFQKLAARYQIDIVTGSSMEGTPEGNFNTSYYINAQGEVLGTYRKNHLYRSEYSFLKPGTEALIFDTSYGRVGIVICWDLLFPELFQWLKRQRVEILYCPSYWYQEIAGHMGAQNPQSEARLVDALCMTRAVETNCALVYCNAAGVMRNPDGSVDTLIGHSQVVMPILGPVKRIEHSNEEMYVVEIDTDLLKESEKIHGA
jgi:predicted amidohydrolase